jgi:hypothetical protein
MRIMMIIKCPKGGRVPEGYCRKSCLNYPGKAELEKRHTMREAIDAFAMKRDSYPVELTLTLHKIWPKNAEARSIAL